MNENKMNFIRTTDKETADKVHSLGFTPLSYENGVYTFINCRALNCSDNVDVHKLVYSNTYFG